MEFKDKLQALLDDRDIKSADLCRDTGIPSSLMSNYLNGKKSPGMDNSMKIAEYFHITLDELAGREKMATPEKIEGSINQVFIKLHKEFGNIPENKMKLIVELAKAVMQSDI